MNIRKNFSKKWAIEGGIFSTKRNLQFDYLNRETGLAFQNKISIITYEIPLQALLYIRITDKWYTDAGLGVNFNFLSTYEYQNSTPSFETFLRRRTWATPSLTVSYGIEYRSKKSGFIYLGISINQYLKEYYSATSFSANPKVFDKKFNYRLSANYFSFDLKYFFPQSNPNEK